MELVHTILNLTALPLTFIFLCFLTPAYWAFKLLRFISNSLFSENVTGKVIVITGASSGIGEHLAYEYARRGASLVLSARRENRLKEVAKKAKNLGSPDVLVVPADVSKVDDCQRLVDKTINHYGRVDHLVNNAGVASIDLFEDYTDISCAKSLMEINFWGSICTTKFAAPYLRRSKGKIIAIASAASWAPAPAQSFYNASKAAMVLFFETLRSEFAPDIKITIVTPGYVESEMTIQGRHLHDSNKMEINEKAIEVLEKTKIPIGSTERCATAIVNSACRGDRYLTEPAWMKAVYYLGLMCPELLEWYFRIAFVKQLRKNK